MKILYVKNLENFKNQNIFLSYYISYIFKNMKRDIVFKSIRKKGFRVNDKLILKDVLLKNNDKISIFVPDYMLYNLKTDFKCVYEDENILCIVKPNNLVSNNPLVDFDENNQLNISSPSFYRLIYKNTNINKLENKKNLKICHRLDKDTTGIIIFTKNDIAYEEMLNAFKNKKIKKEYIAYVKGTSFNKEHEILNNYILKDIKNNEIFCKIVDKEIKNAKPCKTEYYVEEKYNKLNISKLRIILHTGRTHQIRVHMQSIGHEIVGETKYICKNINNTTNYVANKLLLFVYKYSFNFDKNSILYYLNNICIKDNIDSIDNLINIKGD